MNAYESDQHDGMVDVSIPVEVAGVPEGYATQLDLVKFARRAGIALGFGLAGAVPAICPRGVEFAGEHPV